MAKNWAQKQYRFLHGTYDNRLLKKLAEYENNRQWQDIFNRLVSKAVNQYEWTGDVPETIDPYFFEEQLLFRGIACWVKLTDDIYWSLPCIPVGTQNIYYEHNYYRAVSIGFSKEFRAITHYNKDVFELINQIDSSNNAELDGCVCFDNTQKYPMIETISIYADKITDAMRTVDVLAKQLKIGSIIETDEDSKLAIQTAIAQIDQNVLAIYANSNIATRLKESKALNTGSAPAALVAAWNHLTSLWSEFNTAFGIENMNRSEKRERLIVDEVNANNEEVNLNEQYRLDQRLHFCENLKAAFGINVSCKVKHEQEVKESEEDGGLYDNSERDNTDETSTSSER